MSVGAAAIATFETLFNQALKMDPEAVTRLASMHGRVIAISPTGLGLTLYFIPGPSSIQIFSVSEVVPDCTLYGTPMQLAKMRSSHASADQLFSGSVKIEGDSSLAHEFGDMLAGLDIDWEEHLSHLTGDVIAHEVGNLSRGLLGWGGNLIKTAGLNLQEYLHEELRLLPNQFELEPFLTEVDQLRDDSERLAARIQHLRDRIKSEPDQ